MALYLPLSAGAYFDKLQDQRLDQWLKLLLLQRFSCDLFSFRPCSCTHLKVQYLNAPSALGKVGPRLILMLSVFE